MQLFVHMSTMDISCVNSYVTSNVLFLQHLASTKHLPGIRVVSVQTTSIKLDREEWASTTYNKCTWSILQYYVKLCTHSNCTVHKLYNTGPFTFTATNLQLAAKYTIKCCSSKFEWRSGAVLPTSSSVNTSYRHVYTCISVKFCFFLAP